MSRSIVLLALSLVTTIACGTSDGEHVDTSPQPLVDGCERQFACKVTAYNDFKVSGAPVPRSGHRDGDACVAWGFRLGRDGSAQSDEMGRRPDKWTGDTAGFDACVIMSSGGRYCMHCEDSNLAKPAPAPAPSGGGRCTGSPDLCSSQSPGWCSDIRGCRMSTETHYNGTYTNECTGMADSCDDMPDEAACKKQGCDWH